MNENLTPKESLEIISGMIKNRKTRLKSNGFMILFWGWLVIAAAIGQIILMLLELYSICWTPWLLTLAGGVFAIFYGRSCKEKRSEQSHLDVISGTVWLLFALNAMILGFVFLPLVLGIKYMGIVLILLGIASVTEGVVSQFRPSVIGGIISNVLGFVNLLLFFFLKDDPMLWIYTFVLLILGIFVTNIIPGYIIRRRYYE
ncbi:MAG: hypothetical protein EOL88_15225 [Bacteroidia bacterium]|nr:hypothetical protein [Bacteroidales bacterium]NCD43421.1 hypothetical protein [Bacteroidia bacterium]MDD2322647.1 hypothetical protein [Bacteroidales bacterium]MDD3011165.1 hypothetical protein [Bacteroidales bacterium]MDD3961818.1 hypothetical protein [Bacteroidales bacterium]